MKEILHVVNYLNHPDQPYMTQLFRSLNSNFPSYVHKVFCIRNLKYQDDIPFISVGVKKNLFTVSTISFILRTLLFRHAEFNWEKNSSLKSKAKFLLKYKELLRSKATTIHVHHLHMVNPQVMKFLQSKGKSTILSLRGRDLIISALDDMNKSKLLKMITYFDRVHVNSDYLRQFAINNGIEMDKLVMIYRGVEKVTYKKENLNTSSWQGKTEKLRIIIVGRLNWEKGIIYIIDSIFRLTRRGYNIRCDIFGEGRQRKYLDYRINQLGLMDVVTLKGYVVNDELRRLYKNYHLALQASLYESLPNGLLEMSLHNLPCVTSNVGGIREFIKDDVNGIFFDIKTPEELDEAIVKATKLNKVVLREFNNGLFEKFSNSKSLKSLNELYRTV